MSKKTISPKIISFSWGKVKTTENIYKDAKLYPGGSRMWDWNETGTRHVPGIQPADVDDLLEHGAEVIVLSKGVNERLQVCDETVQMLEDNDLGYFILQSEKAVEKYNTLCEDTR